MQLFFLVFDIALIRRTLLQSTQIIFVGQNLKDKRTVFMGRREYHLISTAHYQKYTIIRSVRML